MFEAGKPKALLLYSGGFDSTVLLHELLQVNYDVTLLYFNYAQVNYVAEKRRINYWMNKFNLELIEVMLPHPSWSNTSLTGGKGSTYLESRNLIFLSYAISIAEARGIPEIYVGFIDGNDPDAYPDVRPGFLKAIDMTAYQLAKIQVFAPYILMEKDAVKDHAENNLHLDMREILENTFSCNAPVDVFEPCGNCIDCQAIEQYFSELSG